VLQLRDPPKQLDPEEDDGKEQANPQPMLHKVGVFEYREEFLVVVLPPLLPGVDE
jgi:hypothetical protein